MCATDDLTDERDPLRVTGHAYPRTETTLLEFTVPSQSLIEAFDAAQRRHADAVANLIPLLVEIAVTSVAEMLPGASVLETEGEMNEDWLFSLRIQRVLGAGGEVLYDIETGHDDPEVETRIDEVGFEYLDLLLDLTGDDYLGRKTVVLPLV
jgi:hypothetical protein